MMDNQRNKWESVQQALSHVKELFTTGKIRKKFAEGKAALDYCAQNEDAIAQYQLYALEYNKLVEESENESSIFWCKNAAEQGYAPAQYDLALHYLYGDQVEQDYFKALVLMEQAADKDYIDAIKKLISIYMAGSKVQRNLERAAYWQDRLENIGVKIPIGILPLEPWMLELRRQEKQIPEWMNNNISDVIAHNFKASNQESLINADASTSFVVNAGPGTGKTYTLIRRIDSLVSQGLDADAVQVLSFTNAVVKEIKNRLYNRSMEVDGNRSLRNVSVNTFHSLGYWFLKNAKEQPDMEEFKNENLDLNVIGYEDCLIKASKLLDKYPDVLQGWQYVIVDEIQDINEGKAQFVLSLINACQNQGCPYMLLGDTCQSIYDFIYDVDRDEQKSNTSGCSITTEEFYREILKNCKGKAEFVSLEKNYRQNERLKSIGQAIRQVILNEEDGLFRDKVWDLENVIEEVELENLKEFLASNKGDSICFMLRNNFNTKLFSKILLQNDIEHKCVLNHGKNLYPRWMGELLADYYEDYIDYTTYTKRMSTITSNINLIEASWRRVGNYMNNTSDIYEVKRFIWALQSHAFDEMFIDNSENCNIVVSNIHRSKGLEYDVVVLDKPFVRSMSYRSPLNMRELYVAITRPRKDLFLFAGVKEYNRIRYKSKNGYRYSLAWKKIAENEFRLKYLSLTADGQFCDVGPEAYVFESDIDMANAQDAIQNLNINDPIALLYDKVRDLYSIQVSCRGKRTIIGWMPKQFTINLCCLAGRKRLPVMFDELYVEGIYTFMGSTDQAREKFEKELIRNNSKYGKYRIWNYVLFSGPAVCIYEE